MLECRNRTTYGMSHTLLKYIDLKNPNEMIYYTETKILICGLKLTNKTLKDKTKILSLQSKFRRFVNCMNQNLISHHFYFLDMVECIWIKFYSFIFEVLYIVIFSHISNTFSRKNIKIIWFFHGIYSSLQMRRMNYISKYFSDVLWNFLKILLGCPFGGTCLQPVI